MKKLFTLTFVLLCTCLATLRAADYTGSTPEAGKTYYLLNVQKGEFLGAATDGTLTLGGTKLSVTLSEKTTDGYYTLTTDKGKLSASLWGAPTCDGTGKYDEWTFSPVSGSDKTYAIGARSKEASSAQWLYYSELLQGVRTEPFKPGEAFKQGQWKLVGQASDEVVNLDEASTSYTVPTIGTSGSVTVHLKRTLTVNSWNSFCVPFAIPADQLKAQFGDKVQVAELTGITATTIDFTSRSDIEAGKPYLVYVTNATPSDGYYTFTGVTSFASTPTDVTVSDNTGESLTFNGNFYKTTATKGAYVLSKNQVYHLQKDMDIKGFRGMIIQRNTGSGAKVFNAWSLDGTTTGIGTINATTDTRFDVYNVNGQMLRHAATSLDDLPHGVYIVNGKKITK